MHFFSFFNLGTSLLTAKKYYYDKRYLSLLRAQQTEMANRDPFPKNSGNVSHRSSRELIDSEHMESEASSADEEVVEDTSLRGLLSDESIGSDADVEFEPDVSVSLKENEVATVTSDSQDISVTVNETLDLEHDKPASVRDSSPETDASSGPSPPSPATMRLAREIAIEGIEATRAQTSASSLKLHSSQTSKVPSNTQDISVTVTETSEPEHDRPASVRVSSPGTDASSGPSPPSSATMRLAREIAIEGIEEMRAQMTASSSKLHASQISEFPFVVQDISGNVTETLEPEHGGPASVREPSPGRDVSIGPSLPSSAMEIRDEMTDSMLKMHASQTSKVTSVTQDSSVTVTETLEPEHDRPAFIETMADASTGEPEPQKSIEEEEVQQPREAKAKFSFRKTTN